MTKTYITTNTESQVLTNKTIDADSNIIQNLEAGNFKAQETTEAGKVLGVSSTGTMTLLNAPAPLIDNITIKNDEVAGLTAHGCMDESVVSLTVNDGTNNYVLNNTSDGYVNYNGTRIRLNNKAAVIENPNTTSASYLLLKNSGVSTGYTGINGGSTGAQMILYGSTHSNKGNVYLRAYDGSNGRALTVDAANNNTTLTTQTLTVGDGTTSVAGVKPYSVDTSGIQISGGATGGTGGGANLLLYGKSKSSVAGYAYLIASDGTNTNNITLIPSGSTTMTGSTYTLGKTTARTTIYGNNSGTYGLSIYATTGSSYGSYIALNGKDASSNAGSVAIVAKDNDHTRTLRVNPSNLKFGNHYVAGGWEEITLTTTSYYSGGNINAYASANMLYITFNPVTVTSTGKAFATVSTTYMTILNTGIGVGVRDDAYPCNFKINTSGEITVNNGDSNIGYTGSLCVPITWSN